jgi:hypothetical protein
VGTGTPISPALFIGEPIERLLDGEIGAPLSLASARICKHVGPPFFAGGLLGCAHDRCSTASRACNIALMSLGTSGRLGSRNAKFGLISDAVPFL